MSQERESFAEWTIDATRIYIELEMIKASLRALTRVAKEQAAEMAQGTQGAQAAYEATLQKIQRTINSQEQLNAKLRKYREEAEKNAQVGVFNNRILGASFLAVGFAVDDFITVATQQNFTLQGMANAIASASNNLSFLLSLYTNNPLVIIGPAIAAALIKMGVAAMRSTDDLKEGEEQIKNYEKALQSLQDTVDKMKLGSSEFERSQNERSFLEAERVGALTIGELEKRQKQAAIDLAWLKKQADAGVIVDPGTITAKEEEVTQLGIDAARAKKDLENLRGNRAKQVEQENIDRAAEAFEMKMGKAADNFQDAISKLLQGGVNPADLRKKVEEAVRATSPNADNVSVNALVEKIMRDASDAAQGRQFDMKFKAAEVDPELAAIQQQEEALKADERLMRQKFGRNPKGGAKRAFDRARNDLDEKRRELAENREAVEAGIRDREAQGQGPGPDVQVKMLGVLGEILTALQDGQKGPAIPGLNGPNGGRQ